MISVVVVVVTVAAVVAVVVGGGGGWWWWEWWRTNLATSHARLDRHSRRTSRPGRVAVQVAKDEIVTSDGDRTGQGSLARSVLEEPRLEIEIVGHTEAQAEHGPCQCEWRQLSGCVGVPSGCEQSGD